MLRLIFLGSIWNDFLNFVLLYYLEGYLNFKEDLFKEIGMWDFIFFKVFMFCVSKLLIIK